MAGCALASRLCSALGGWAGLDSPGSSTIEAASRLRAEPAVVDTASMEEEYRLVGVALAAWVVEQFARQEAAEHTVASADSHFALAEAAQTSRSAEASEPGEAVEVALVMLYPFLL